MKITLLSGKTFDINADLGFDMKVVHSGRSRRLTLRIDKKDRMAVLTIPKYCSRKRQCRLWKAIRTGYAIT